MEYQQKRPRYRAQHGRRWVKVIDTRFGGHVYAFHDPASGEWFYAKSRTMPNRGRPLQGREVIEILAALPELAPAASTTSAPERVRVKNTGAAGTVIARRPEAGFEWVALRYDDGRISVAEAKSLDVIPHVVSLADLPDGPAGSWPWEHVSRDAVRPGDIIDEHGPQVVARVFHAHCNGDPHGDHAGFARECHRWCADLYAATDEARARTYRQVGGTAICLHHDEGVSRLRGLVVAIDGLALPVECAGCGRVFDADASWFVTAPKEIAYRCPGRCRTSQLAPAEHRGLATPPAHLAAVPAAPPRKPSLHNSI